MEQSEHTRQQIVEAATRLFARKGYFGTSIAALAQATGLTKGALYHHFEGKEAHFFAVVESVRRTWEREVAREVSKEKDPLARLAKLLDSHTRLLSENEMLCLVMTNLMPEMENVNPEYVRILQRVYEDLTLFLERIIRDGQAVAAIRADVNPRLVALNIVGMLKGIGSTQCRCLAQADFSLPAGVEAYLQEGGIARCRSIAGKVGSGA